MDLDAFFCACEELNDPALRGTTFAVGGSAERRGVISSCSYAARAMGVHSAMPTSRALRICPTLKLICGHYADYSALSQRVMKILTDTSPFIEQVSIDEAFLDITCLREGSCETALALQTEVWETLGLPCSLGAASNKLVAKMANTIGKKSVRTTTYPQSIKYIPDGEEAAFLAPLAVGKLWGIGEASEKQLRGLGITTIGQLAQYPLEVLVKRFGKRGYELHEHANGRDDSPVNTEHEDPKSVSQEYTFERDESDEQALLLRLLWQSEQVGARLRKYGLKGNVVHLKLRRSDFLTITRQMRLSEAVNRESVIFEQAKKLFVAAWASERFPVRLIGLGVSGFDSDDGQLSFFTDANAEKEDRLLKAVDAIRGKYGKDMIKRGKW